LSIQLLIFRRFYYMTLGVI